MIARSPFLRLVQSTNLDNVDKVVGCEYEVQLAGRRLRGLTIRVEGGYVVAVRRKFRRPWRCLPTAWEPWTNEAKAKRIHAAEYRAVTLAPVETPVLAVPMENVQVAGSYELMPDL